jgi:hypothetical protein
MFNKEEEFAVFVKEEKRKDTKGRGYLVIES